MKHVEILEKHRQFCWLIKEKKVKDAFDLLNEITEKFQANRFKFSIENYYETYKNILKYSFELVEDPEKEKIYNHLLKSLLDLADEIKEAVIIQNKFFNYYKYKEEIVGYDNLSVDDSEKLVDKVKFGKEIEKIIKETGGIDEAGNKIQFDEKTLSQIFTIIWFTDRFKDAEINLVKQLCKSEIIPWYDKCSLVSSLSLSLHRYFDENKIKLLFEFYENKEKIVWQHALVGIFTAIVHYNDRITFYPDIIFKLQELSEDKSFRKDFENIIIQYIRSKETEKITKKLQEEILPAMMKYRSELVDKLDLDKIISEHQLEDKNPEWETVFKDSPGLYDKLEEFSKLQMEGADVFIGAFSMLKHFPFFNRLNNWFVPFHKENPEVNKSLENFSEPENTRLLIEGLEKSAFLCNSDKYSFCYNLSFLPSSQKKMIANLFNMELKAMNEIAEDDELINARAKNKAIFTQYMQDLYRFYKLHPLRKEFTDLFGIEFNFKDSIIFSSIIKDGSILRNIGEFYFEKEYYNEALAIFDFLSFDSENFEILEKLGYCHQQLGNYDKALQAFIKAELYDSNKLWILKRIANCYQMLGKYKDAIRYYEEAERLNPEDLYIQAYLGHSYMDLGEYEKALKYYYKVEYLAPDNQKIQRPIAWCSFILGKFEPAKKYFEKAIKKENNKHDYLNLGHVEWCTGNKQQAISSYKEAIRRSGFDFNWFNNEYHNDSKYLIKHGIDKIDLPLMLDFVKINARKDA